MTDNQITTIKCAYADLIGSYQAYRRLDTHSHDWEAHFASIREMERDFIFLEPFTEAPSNPNIIVESCSCGKNHEPNPNQFIAITQNGNPVRNAQGCIELYDLYEEAVLNSSGNKEPIQVANTSLEIQNEIRRKNKIEIQHKHNTTQHE